MVAMTLSYLEDGILQSLAPSSGCCVLSIFSSTEFSKTQEGDVNVLSLSSPFVQPWVFIPCKDFLFKSLSVGINIDI